MKLSPRTITISAIVTISLLLIAEASFGTIQLFKIIPAREWVVHTLGVVQRLHMVRATVREAESSQRGFLLTEDEDYLTPFKEDVKKIDGLVNEVAELTKDNPLQQQHVGSLRVKIDDKFALMNNTISLMRSGKRKEAFDNVRTHRGKKMMEDIAQIIGAMTTEENRLLSERMGALNTQTTLAIVANGILNVSVLVGILLLAIYAWRLFKLKEKISADLREGKLIAEQAARELRAIIDSSGDPFVRIDSAGAVIDWNPAAEKCFGWTRNEAMNQYLFNLIIPTPFRQAYMDSLASFRTRGAGEVLNKRSELQAIHKDGHEVPIEFYIFPIELKDALTFGAFISDITVRKNVEKRVSEFYSVVSHELRTPLTSIRGSLRLMEGGKTGDLPAKAMNMIKIGRTQCDRLVALVNDILDIKKIEANQLELNRVPIEPSKIVVRTLEGLAGLQAESHVRVESEIATNQLVLADFERLVQVLTNLVSNAIKFTTSDDHVTVTVSEKNDGLVRFAVKDNGPGIKSDEIPKLFNMFQQLDSSDTRQKGGTGLGLAIAKSIVEQHNGAIGVDSDHGKGSTFWFEIPIYRSHTGKIRIVERDSYFADMS